ncbi:unnamed protein product [Larinioides sclopetarius]|uniref:TIL domain-containing protein n=1 Tax=Larinioides sclopetarius TaxID=280406 RepID=A0AAV2B2C2_9ARAC
MALLHFAKYVLLSFLGLSTNLQLDPPTNLTALCSTGEVYSECQGHCGRNCCNIKEPPSCATDICVPACVCAEGLVRGPDGACVPESTCADPTTETTSAWKCCFFIICHNTCAVMSKGKDTGRCVNGECECIPKRKIP